MKMVITVLLQTTHLQFYQQGIGSYQQEVEKDCGECRRRKAKLAKQVISPLLDV